MNIAITLNNEETDAMTALVERRNAGLPKDAVAYTIESHLAEVLAGHITEVRREAYAASLTRLGDAAAALPYESRKAIIEQVEAAIQ